MKRLAACAMLTVCVSSLSDPGAAFDPAGACEREIAPAARRHGIPIPVLEGIGMTETGRGDGLRPYALNIAGRAVYDLDLEAALREFEKARAQGIKLIDVGCMQINHHYHKQHFASVREMFDPSRNVDYAARFLKSLHNEEGNWTRASARYHAGKRNLPAQRRYVCAVIKKLIASGRGAWTRNAKAYCGASHESTSRSQHRENQAEQQPAKWSWRASVQKQKSKRSDELEITIRQFTHSTPPPR